MPIGDTSMTYPFPYKTADGDIPNGTGGGTIDANTINANFVNVAEELQVDQTATISALVVEGTMSAPKFTGTENLNGDSITSQQNLNSLGNQATSIIQAKNDSSNTTNLGIGATSNAIYPNRSFLTTSGSSGLTVNTIGTGKTIVLSTNGIPRATISDTGVNVPTLTISSLVLDGVSANSVLGVDGSNVLTSFTKSGTGSVAFTTSPSFTTPILGTASATGLSISSLSASLPVFTNGSKNLVSASVTGTGNVVLNTSPSLVTPDLGAASASSLTVSGLIASRAVFTDGSKNLTSVATTGSGNVVLDTSPTLVTPVIGSATGTSLQLTGLTASQAVVTDASKNLSSLQYTDAATASTIVSRDSNSNSTFNNAFTGSLVVAGASGTTVMTSATPLNIIQTSGTQQWNLPPGNTIPLGTMYTFNSFTNGALINVRDSAGNSLTNVTAVNNGARMRAVLTTAGNPGTWSTYNDVPFLNTIMTSFTGNNFVVSGPFTSSRYTSNIATGTAPITCTSTTVCPNLNASFLNGATFASPGTIGGTTAGAANFTSVNVSGLTASQAVVTDGSKNLSSLGFSGLSTSATIPYYIETSFTPTYYTPTLGGVTYFTQFGKAYRLGNMVFYNITMNFTPSGTSGIIEIRGLPYTNNANNIATGTAYIYGSLGLAQPSIRAVIEQSTSVINIVQTDSAGASTKMTGSGGNGNISGNVVFVFSVCASI